MQLENYLTENGEKYLCDNDSNNAHVCRRKETKKRNVGEERSFRYEPYHTL